MNITEKWLLCPSCGGKTRVKLRQDTELRNFLLFCPKCKREVLISVSEFITTKITEPDAICHKESVSCADHPYDRRRRANDSRKE